MAARCDRTIAATAPVELYSVPPVDTDSENEGEVDSTTASEVQASVLKTETDRARAQMDHQKAVSIRRSLLRDANVTRTEAIREAKTVQRLAEIQQRHEALLVVAKQKAEEKRQEELEAARKEAEARAEAKRRADEEAGKRDPFELLRQEERRRLQHFNTTSNGISKEHSRSVKAIGIVGLYNEVVLDTLFEADGRPKVEAGADVTLFPSEVQADVSVSGSGATRPRHPAAKLVIPKEVTRLMQEGYGQDQATAIIERCRQRKAQLSALSANTTQAELAEREQALASKASQDNERQNMLRELVVQDNERSRKAMDDATASRIALERSKPYNPNKPEHPIDVYRRQIREDILGDRALTEEEKKYRATLKRLTM